jgi:hypothetical protein
MIYQPKHVAVFGSLTVRQLFVRCLCMCVSLCLCLPTKRNGFRHFMLIAFCAKTTLVHREHTYTHKHIHFQKCRNFVEGNAVYGKDWLCAQPYPTWDSFLGIDTSASCNDIVAVWHSVLDYANNPDNLPAPTVAATTRGGPVSPSYFTRNVHI